MTLAFSGNVIISDANFVRGKLYPIFYLSIQQVPRSLKEVEKFFVCEMVISIIEVHMPICTATIGSYSLHRDLHPTCTSGKVKRKATVRNCYSQISHPTLKTKKERNTHQLINVQEKHAQNTE